MADEAVLDVPVVEEIAPEPVVEGAEPAAEPHIAGAVGVQDADVKGDHRLIKQPWRDLKGTHPDLYKEYTNTLFGKKALEEKLTGFDLDDVRSWLDESGGKQGVVEQLTSLAAARDELNGINEAISNGDVAILDRFAESAPDGFAKIAPAMVQKWAQVDPEGYQAGLSGVFGATIQQAGLLPLLDRMELMLQYNDTKGFGEQLASIKQWAQSYGQVQAGQTTKAATRPATQLDAREKALADREQKIYAESLERSVEAKRSDEISKQLGSFFDRRKDDAEAKQIAIDQVRNQVLQRLNADKDFTTKLMSLRQRRDADGEKRLIESRERPIIAEIAPKVGRAIFGNPQASPTPKAEPKEPVVPRGEVPAKITDPKKALFAEIAAR